MSAPLVPATPAFAPDGTPFSRTFGDVYHSAAGGPAQARHVFLGGAGLPERWRGRRTFTILETGFGLGLGFLAAWQAWRDDPQRCTRLHFVSVEKHPFTRDDLAEALRRYPELKAAALVDAWPPLLPGMHRLDFGGVVLTLLFADVGALRELELAADAIFLDGFAPAKNPEMWAPAVFRQVARLAAPGATAATWSVAAEVRRGLEQAGFGVQKRPGFAAKKEMLCAVEVRKRKGAPPPSHRSAIVVGAGVAGAAVSERLCARGWQVTLIERRAGPAEEASGNPAGVFHPLVSPDDSRFARITRAAFLELLRRWPALEELRWDRCGVLQLARDAHELDSQRRAVAALAAPPEYAQFREAAGLWFPQAGWVKPRSLVSGLIGRCGSRLASIFGCEVRGIERQNESWRCSGPDGGVVAEAPVLVLANAAEALRLAPQPAVQLRRVRGQLTLVPALPGLDHVVLRGGMALPGIDGTSVVGASYDLEDDDTAVRADSHAGNLERLEAALPGAARGLDPAHLEGRVAFRAVSRDRLPLAGALAHPAGAGLFGAFGYGSRGLLWAPLAAELLASRLEGEPLPVERALAAALDPARFALRAARRRPLSARA